MIQVSHRLTVSEESKRELPLNANWVMPIQLFFNCSLCLVAGHGEGSQPRSTTPGEFCSYLSIQS